MEEREMDASDSKHTLLRFEAGPPKSPQRCMSFILVTDYSRKTIVF